MVAICCRLLVGFFERVDGGWRESEEVQFCHWGSDCSLFIIEPSYPFVVEVRMMKMEPT